LLEIHPFSAACLPTAENNHPLSHNNNQSQAERTAAPSSADPETPKEKLRFCR
jgi:hypothetical protein